MNMLIGSLTFLPLLVVAVATLLWALGATWPIRSRELLAQTVIGTPGVTRMPNRLLLLGIAILAIVVGIVALSLADQKSGGPTLTAIGALCAVAFLARGVLGYTVGWRARFPTEPFATLDRRNYSPLALWVGIGFALLVLMRLL
jgi:uncharacterized protein DUF3995